MPAVGRLWPSGDVDDDDDGDDCFGLPGENASYLWLGAHLKRQGL